MGGTPEKKTLFMSMFERIRLRGSILTGSENRNVLRLDPDPEEIFPDSLHRIKRLKTKK
jgi:hypothetical protein